MAIDVRAERVRALVREDPPPGVIAYDGDVPVGLGGSVDFARAHGAPAIDGYPVDNKGVKVDLTMAYVGTRKLFEAAGIRKAADTDSVLAGFPRVLMRKELS